MAKMILSPEAAFDPKAVGRRTASTMTGTKSQFLIAAVCMAAFCSSYATNWGQTTIEDPISGGDCDAFEIVSYGSYIYDWPSKYDGVYWPFTDSHWIWQCPESGYLSFGDDFSELTEAEIGRISAYLSEPSSRLGSDLDRLESIYRLRDKDDRFWAWFYRVKAAILSSQADAARFDALPLLKELEQSLNPSFELIQVYFVIRDYHRRFGDIDLAQDYFAKARAVEWVDEDGGSQIGSEYINELIDERMTLLSE